MFTNSGVQPVDGTAQFDGSAGMSASAKRQGERKRVEHDRDADHRSPKNAYSFESRASALCEAVKADLP
jgi:hypothetical protein